MPAWITAVTSKIGLITKVVPIVEAIIGEITKDVPIAETDVQQATADVGKWIADGKTVIDNLVAAVKKAATA